MKQYFVGVDVSKNKLDFAIDNTKLFKSFDNDEFGIKTAISWLENNTNNSIKIVIESTSWYHWLVCLLLSESNYEVCLINPLITKKYQKSSIRDSKNDKIDAYRLAEIAKLESGLPKFFDSRETLRNKRIHTLLKTLENIKQQLTRSLNDAINAFAILGVDVDTKDISEALLSIDIAIKSCKKIIENNSDELAERLTKIRGISRFQASVLSTAVSGRSFDKREKIVAFFGLDVKVRQSGNWHGKSCLSKRGNPYYRKILFHIGWSLKQNNEIFKRYYDKLIDNGKHYYTAILATARKFLYYFFKVYREVYGISL